MPDIPISSITDRTTTETSKPTNIMDSDGFLKLLIAQLQNQDPSSPMDTQAMMQQTTQLSMMEQMVSMAKDSQAALALQQRTLASQMVGAQVTYCTSDGGNATGLVESVIYTVGEPTLVIGGQYVLLSSVASVSPPSAKDPDKPADDSQKPADDGTAAADTAA